jgi:ABC-type uncharacterized transport system involved in gliding motility auxiliary subunit
MAARTETRRNALLTIAAVLVGAVALNTVIDVLVPWFRVDLTQDRLYSTSKGVDAALATLDEPVRVDYYWTQEGSKDQPLIRAHAQRVREYLEELERRSKGNLEVRFVDPEPFSEAEDEARAAGLPALAVDGSGRTLTLGLVVRGPTDRKETIPYLSPENEPLLEYELLRAITSVGRPTKPRVGLLSTIPLTGGMDPRNPMQMKGAPVVIEQLREQADVVDVDAAADALPAGDLAALVLVQPRKLSDGMLRAIDAWAVAGKPLIVLADPYAETDTGPDAAAMGAKRGGTTYDLGPLLAAWGLDIPKDMVVGDLAYATRIRAPSRNGGVRELDYPAWLSMTAEALAKGDPLVGGLQSLNMMSVGEIRQLEGATSRVEPLVRSSDRSQLIQTLKLGFFGDPEQLLKDFKADGTRKVLAARIGGEISSAFPAADGTAEKGKANILLFADADLIADDTWVIDDRVAGMSVGKRAIADNGPLLLNAVELAAGNPALAGIRARGQFRRPFTVVEEMRRDAETKFIAREKELQDEIQRTELQIGELQRERTADGAQAIVLTPEQAKRIEELQQRMVEARKELRQVQHGLRKDVEGLGTRLLVANAVLWPLLVAAAALAWYVVRGRSSRREATT